MFFHFELLGGKYHINANFCYNHLFTLYYVLKEVENLRGCLIDEALPIKFFFITESLLYLISNYLSFRPLIYIPN